MLTHLLTPNSSQINMLFRKIIIPLLSIFATVNAGTAASSSSSDSEDAIFDSLSDVDAIDALLLLLASNIATGIACQDSAYVLAAGLQNVEITIAASQKLVSNNEGWGCRGCVGHLVSRFSFLVSRCSSRLTLFDLVLTTPPPQPAPTPTDSVCVRWTLRNNVSCRRIGL